MPAATTKPRGADGTAVRAHDPEELPLLSLPSTTRATVWPLRLSSLRTFLLVGFLAAQGPQGLWTQAFNHDDGFTTPSANATSPFVPIPQWRQRRNAAARLCMLFVLTAKECRRPPSGSICNETQVSFRSLPFSWQCICPGDAFGSEATPLTLYADRLPLATTTGWLPGSRGSVCRFNYHSHYYGTVRILSGRDGSTLYECPIIQSVPSFSTLRHGR